MATSKQTTKNSIPEGAKKPQDRQTASKDVEQPETIEFEWRGQKFTAETRMTQDARLMRHLEKNELFSAIELVLSEAQVDRLVDHVVAAEGWFDPETLREFVTELFEAVGQGNS